LKRGGGQRESNPYPVACAPDPLSVACRERRGGELQQREGSEKGLFNPCTCSSFPEPGGKDSSSAAPFSTAGNLPLSAGDGEGAGG
jgi:hypothetical protein